MSLVFVCGRAVLGSEQWSYSIELRTMADVSADETVLFFRSGVQRGVAEPRHFLIVVVVAPFCKVVGKLETRSVCVGILKINDDELFVGVCRE